MIRIVASILEIPLLVAKKNNTRDVIANKTSKSNFIRLLSIEMLVIELARPIGTRISKIVLPMIFPRDIPGDFLNAAPTDTDSSGKLVQRQIITIPTKDCVIPHFSAKCNALETTKCDETISN